MKKIKLSIFVLSAISGLMLSGCKDKNSDASPSSSGGSSEETTEEAKETRYTVTASEYSSIRSYFSDERIFLNENLTFTGSLNLKIDAGKLDEVDEYSRMIWVLDKSTYNSETGAISVDKYLHADAEDYDWIHMRDDGYSLGIIQSTFMLFNFDFYMAENFAELTYSEETHKYTDQYLDYDIYTEYMFENGKLVWYRVSGDDIGADPYEYQISNYGTTHVTVPTDRILEDNE